ncbi:MAG: hypothetical protein NZ840_02265 [Anaerolineales bacterium]|nr:hypothetical protein [Anaerolineales bacterium]MDW8160860.1 hypothetical protein [Anaerolineales bacterium]
MRVDKSDIALAALAVLSSTAYLFYSAAFYRVGFPLDDAWIHQTYARSLAQGEGWSFEPGVVSGGTTSPFWVLLLSLGYLLQIPPFAWSFFLGIGCLVGIGICGMRYFRQIHPSLGWLGLFLILEWHFTWASVSGMETLLATLIVFIVFSFLSLEKVDWGLSLLMAVSIWVRPDLITLLLPLVAHIFVRLRNEARILRSYLPVFIAMGASLAGYIAFNIGVSGTWFPTTFYAKQAEYAELRQSPFLYRFGQQFFVALIGGGIFLLPGVLYEAYRSWREKDWNASAWLLWYLGVLGLYAVRLPVTYQHGRYIMPALAVFYTLGLKGSVFAYRWLAGRQKIGWILSRAGVFSWIVVTLGFWGMGGSAYARDVAVIETQMVNTAKWAALSLPTRARIAVHDIGAIGYYTEHQILDLAGLINPEVIPFLRDEERLARYLDEQGVDFLICFPNWYPHLTQDLEAVYIAEDWVLKEYNERPMTVYRWGLNDFISLPDPSPLMLYYR